MVLVVFATLWYAFICQQCEMTEKWKGMYDSTTEALINRRISEGEIGAETVQTLWQGIINCT